MFKFLVKKGLYNLVLKKYEKHLSTYLNTKQKIFDKILTHELPPEALCTKAIETRQEYFTLVFNDVCQDISSKIDDFKQLLPIKIAAYDFNPDELRPDDIYKFVYWCITGREANSKNCDKIATYIYDLMKKK